MLTAERSALNTVQHLSGIATMTAAYVSAIAGTGATLLDTRKTIPGLRLLEKYATRMGGAQNHRMGLWDAAMIKDNHVAVAGGIGPAVAAAKATGIARIIVEVDSLDQIEPALAAGATNLLLDNMGPAELARGVALVAGRVPTEASGGVRLDTIRAIAEAGVTYVSVGRLTQSAPAADGASGGDLDRALQLLTPDQREVVLLVGLEGLSYAETAEVLSIPIGTVMSRLARGRDRLRTLLAYGLENEAEHGGLRRVK